MGCLRQRRPPRDGVHSELQLDRRRVHRRSRRTAVRQHASASASGAAIRATTSSSPGQARAPGTTTRSCSTRRRPAATQITPYVDGKAVSFHEARQRHGRRALRELGPVDLMSRSGTGAVRHRRPRRGGDLRPRAERGRDRRALRLLGTNRRPVAAFTATPNPAAVQPDGDLQRLGVLGSRRHDAGLRVGSRRQRQLRARRRVEPRDHDDLPPAGRRAGERAGHRRPSGHRHRDEDRHRHRQGADRGVHRLTESGDRGPIGGLRRGRIERPGRHDRQVRVGPRRQRQLRDRHRHDARPRRGATPRPGT